jgi:CxxC-x17-CxxC domain-containing protein
MHDVKCDKCGKQCQVPFKPTGDKPVYCSDCFRQNDSSGARSNFRGNNDSQSGASSAQLDQINKIHNIMGTPP